MKLPKFLQAIYLKPNLTNRALVMIGFVFVLVVIPLWTGLVDRTSLRACGQSWQCLFTNFNLYLLLAFMLGAIIGSYQFIEWIEHRTLNQDDQDQT